MALVPPDETEKPFYFPILAAEEKWNVCGPRGPSSEGAAATKHGGLGGECKFLCSLRVLTRSVTANCVCASVGNIPPDVRRRGPEVALCAAVS